MRAHAVPMTSGTATLGPTAGAGRRDAHAQPGTPGGWGHDLLFVLSPAHLHAGAGGDADRPHPEPQWHYDRDLPGSAGRPALGGMDPGVGAETGGLPDLFLGQVAPGRVGLRVAHRPRLRRDEAVGLYHL